MLSILIPAYNFNVSPLVDELQSQAKKLDELIEIILFDDNSKDYVEENKQIAEKFNLKYKYLEQNLGRSKIRNLLAKHANYEFLLFLDGDVFPKSESFLKTYISFISSETDVIYGGREHEYTEKDKDKLRWKYGYYREDQNAKNRSKTPYLSIITNNLCVKKSVFNSIKFEESLNTYGCEDTLFGFKLKEKNANVLHIENPVIHKDIDNNFVFLSKTRDAWKNLILLENKLLIPKDFRPVQRAYSKLKRFGLVGLCAWMFQTFNSILTKNLTGKSPSLFWFDVYRMLYFCYLKEIN